MQLELCKIMQLYAKLCYTIMQNFVALLCPKISDVVVASSARWSGKRKGRRIRFIVHIAFRRESKNLQWSEQPESGAGELDAGCAACGHAAVILPMTSGGCKEPAND